MKSFSFILIFIILSFPKTFGQSDQFWINYNQYTKAYKEGRFLDSKEILLSLINDTTITPKSYFPYLNNSIGSAYRNLGNIDSANYHYFEAESQFFNSENVDYDLLNSIYNNLAIVFDQKHQYKQALSYYYKSESILNNIQIRDTNFSYKLSALHLNRGIVNYEMSDYTSSLNDLKKAEEIKSKYSLPYLGSVYFNLGRVYSELDEFHLSEMYFIRSIDQWTREYDSTYYQLGSVYFHYGNTLMKNSNKEKGIRVLHKALSNFLKNYGDKHPYTSDCYALLAQYYLEHNDFHNALRYSQQALISTCPNYNTTSILSNPEGYNSYLDINLIEIYQIKVKALIGLSLLTDRIPIDDKILNKKEVLEFALDIVQDELEIIRKVHLNYFDQENRLALNEEFKQVFLDGIEIGSMLYEISNEPYFLNLCFNFASLGKSIEFQYELLERHRIFEDSNNSSVSDLRIRASNFSNYIKIEQQKLTPDSTLIETWRDSLFNINRKHELIVSQILDKSNLKEFFSINVDALQIKEIQKKIKKNQTLIDFTVSDEDEKMYIFILNPRSSKFLELNFDSSEISNIHYIQNSLNSFSLNEYSISSTNSLYASLNKLYHILIAPIEPYIEGNELILIPDDDLILIPFDALFKTYNPETLKAEFLLQDYPISYLLNVQFLKRTKTNRIFLPRVNAFEEQQDNSPNNDIRLFGADIEVDQILKKYKGTIINDFKTKDEINSSLEEKRILHFAMHSYAQDTSFENSYIKLVNSSDSVLSNKLFDYEVSQLNIESPMVVLSSCGSGSGRLYNGEGVMSLSRSFLISGAKSVIHTYWSVNDKSSSQIMIDYYRHLKKGRSKSVALQKAKINYLENSNPTLQHPYFWSGYQISGDSQNIVILRILHLGLGLTVIVFTLIVYLVRRKRRIT